MEGALMEEECRGIIDVKSKMWFLSPRSTQTDPNPFPPLSRPWIGTLLPKKKGNREIKGAIREQEQTSKKKEQRQEGLRDSRSSQEPPLPAHRELCPSNPSAGKSPQPQHKSHPQAAFCRSFPLTSTNPEECLFFVLLKIVLGLKPWQDGLQGRTSALEFPLPWNAVWCTSRPIFSFWGSDGRGWVKTGWNWDFFLLSHGTTYSYIYHRHGDLLVSPDKNKALEKKKNVRGYSGFPGFQNASRDKKWMPQVCFS